MFLANFHRYGAMCDYCVEHGGGKKWYLQARNYLRNKTGTDRRRTEFTRDFIEGFMNRYDRFAATGEAQFAMRNAENANWLVRKMYDRFFRKKHSGQVVPLEEAKLVLELSGQVSLIPCVCRFAHHGVKERVCMLFMAVPDDLWGAKHFDRIRDVESLTLEEAQNNLSNFAEKGLVQTVWTFFTPHIGALCNCDYPYCAAIRGRRHSSVQRALYKAEFVALLDSDQCSGCALCLSRCQFGAITMSVTTGKASLNMFDCFGCGTCRLVCPNDAIQIVPRAEVAEVKNHW